jgi:hypothetical protein
LKRPLVIYGFATAPYIQYEENLIFFFISAFSFGVLTYLVESDLGEYPELDKDSRDDEYNNQTQDCRQDDVVFLQDLRA